MTKILIAAALILGAHAQDTRQVKEPAIPPVCATLPARLTSQQFSLAASDEAKPDTVRIQEALDSCPQGRAVKLTPATGHNAFLSAPLELRRGVTLLVDGGAILFASRNPRDYDVRPGVCGTIDQNGHGCRALLNGDRVSGAAVMGDGVIDGRGGSKIMGEGLSWWQLAEKARAGGNQNNPRILILNHCDNFTLYRITLKDSPNFHVYYGGGNGFTAWGVIIEAPKNARNTDGIDPASSTNVTIAHCFIHAGDDNVAIKAGASGASTHMTIAHNHFYSGHGMSIGSETEGGVSAIRVSDLTIDGADNGIRIKSNSSRGGLVRDVVYEDVCIRHTKNPILMDSNYSFYGRARDKPPTFSGIVLRNIRILTAGKITLDGYDARHRLGIAFDNVIAANPGAMKIAATHADVTLGPGPVNFRPAGPDVSLGGHIGEAQSYSCGDKFVPFPSK